MSELDGIAADLKWLRKSMEDHDKIMAEMFDRLRKLETDMAALMAGQKPPMNPWTIFGIIATIAVSALIVLDRIYVNQ